VLISRSAADLSVSQSPQNLQRDMYDSENQLNATPPGFKRSLHDCHFPCSQKVSNSMDKRFSITPRYLGIHWVL
jgi:hypothetical protein